MLHACCHTLMLGKHWSTTQGEDNQALELVPFLDSASARLPSDDFNFHPFLTISHKRECKLSVSSVNLSRKGSNTRVTLGRPQAYNWCEKWSRSCVGLYPRLNSHNKQQFLLQRSQLTFANVVFVPWELLQQIKCCCCFLKKAFWTAFFSPSK